MSKKLLISLVILALIIGCVYYYMQKNSTAISTIQIIKDTTKATPPVAGDPRYGDPYWQCLNFAEIIPYDSTGKPLVTSNYASATQSSTYGAPSTNYAASNLIDGNLSTAASTTENTNSVAWMKLVLNTPTKLSKIIIYNYAAPGQYSVMEAARIQLSNSSGTVIKSVPVTSLASSPSSPLILTYTL